MGARRMLRTGRSVSRLLMALGLGCALLSGGAASSRAQDGAPADTAGATDATEPPPAWDNTVRARLAGSQTGYHNWQEGGANTLSFTAELRGSAERTTETWKQEQSFRMLFGEERQDGRGFRKSADKLLSTFSLQYQGESSLDPTIAGEFRTQFAPGFSYDKNPFPDGDGTPVKVSDIFSPGYLTQSLGLTYDPADWYRARLGVAGKETVVLIDRLRVLYMDGDRQSVRVQMGMDLQVQVSREIMEDIQLDSQLTVFAAFNKSDLPDMRWQNRVILDVNDWINVDIEAEALYDSDVTRAVQMRETMSLGLQYTFL